MAVIEKTLLNFNGQDSQIGNAPFHLARL